MPDAAAPPTRRGGHEDILHGERVADPYRWMEAATAPEVVAWVRAQNRATDAWLAGVPSREAIRHRLRELWNHPRREVPVPRGRRWFQLRNDGLQEQSVLHVMASADGRGRVLLDPNRIRQDSPVAVSGIAISEDGARVAYATSTAGSDWRTWRVRDVATGCDLPDVVRWSKWSDVAWLHDGSGFAYAALEPPAGAAAAEISRPPAIRLHRLGRPQAHDELIFAAPEEQDWLPAASVTDDGRYLVITITRGTGQEHRVAVLELGHPVPALRALVDDFESTASVVTCRGSTFLVQTDHGCDRGRVMAVDLADPSRAHWREVVPEGPGTLLATHCFGGRLLCHTLRDACAVVRVHDLRGRHLHDVELPPWSTLSGISGRRRGRMVHVAVTSFTDPGSLWRHDLATGATSLVRSSAAAHDPTACVTERVLATSPDGTPVPLLLTRRQDLRPTGDVPALLVGYGGFNVPVGPAFSVAHAAWLERGGLLAFAVLRGGGEYGRRWYDAGRLSRKHNVFDDFCACAEWLAASGWTRSDRIGINGRSNGGLLVGACLARRPELFGAAIAEVGVLDLLRFHRFTIGWAWRSDYGDPDDPQQFAWIRRISPLHTLEAGRDYPATLLMTGDHDDRVPPAHSYKFAAALQAAQGGSAPVLIRVETDAGHGDGTPTAALISQRADMLAFLERALRADDRTAMAPVAAGASA